MNGFNHAYFNLWPKANQTRDAPIAIDGKDWGNGVRVDDQYVVDVGYLPLQSCDELSERVSDRSDSRLRL